MARVFLVGKSGSGKSWFAGKKIAEIVEGEGEDDAFERAIHIDLEDEERGLSMQGDALLKTLEVDKELLQKQYLIDETDPPSFIPEDELKDSPLVSAVKVAFYQNKRVRVVPDGLNDEEVHALTELLADAAMLAGDTHFSMDEAHRIASQSGLGDKMSDLITGGRKRGVEWLFITQRPQAIHKQVLAQTNIGIFFKLTSDRDVLKADRLAENFEGEDVLPALDPRQAIIENYDDGSVKRVDTNDLERKYEHVAGDDGKADDKWMGDGEEIEHTDF
jgi:hypothetical protein